MAAGDLDRLIKGRNDSAGSVIQEFYACSPPLYAVYRTDARVLIEFADADDEERRQRQSLAPLGSIRSEINGLINGWRTSADPRKLANARVFDRRTADALVMALENDAQGAVLELLAVRNAIIDRRKSAARFLYLVTAFATAAAVGLALLVLSIPALGLRGVSGMEEVGVALVGGVGGAFFSIATGLSRRTILTDLQQRDNAIDAMLRMIVGVISAAFLICFLKSGFGITLVTPGTGPVSISSRPDAWMYFFTLGFLAGFSERLIPDLLAKAGSSVEATPLPQRTPIVAAAAPAVAGAVPAVSLPPASPPPPPSTPTPEPPAAPEGDLDGDCLSDTPMLEAEAVADDALPPAQGGVA